MQYDFTLLAGEAKQYEVKGRFIKYKSGLGMIRVRMSKGGYVDLLPGQGVNHVDYENFIITDKSGAGNTGVVLAGDYAFQDDRITGTVDVVDGGKSRTLANTAFQGTTAGLSNAGEYPHAQLWNPVSSTKRLIVKQVFMSSTVQQQVALVFHNAALTSLTATAQSKLANAASSVAETRSQSSATLLGIGAGFVAPYLAASGNMVVTFTEPIILLPGWGLVLRGGVVASQINAAFEFIEELL
jgi:hypothetical protein